MNFFQISELLVGITSTILILITLYSGRMLLHKIWIFFNLCIAIWGYGGYWVTICKMPSEALIAWKITHIGVIFIPISFYHVVYVFTHQQHVKFLRTLYFFGVIFIFLNLFTDTFITHVENVFGSFYYAKSNTLLYKVFFVIWISLVLLGHLLLIKRYREISSPIDRTRIQYFFYAVFTGFIGGVMNFFPIIGINIYPYGNILIPIYCIVITRAILKYRLMDITLVITRTGIFVAVYSIVLGIPFAIAFGWQERLVALFGQVWWVVPLVTSTVLATVGPCVYIYVQKRAEGTLFDEQLRYQTTLRQASVGMGRIKDLKRLVNLIVHIVLRSVRLEHSMLYLDSPDTKSFVLGAKRSRRVKFSAKEEIKNDSALVSELKKTRMPIVYEEIKQRTQDYGDLKLTRLAEELNALNAALVVPSFIDERLLAIIVLGNKVSKKLYTDDDLAVFTILANQAALAIENAMFYRDMHETHEQLFKAEKMATIGTMADGLSHQINNRFHALGFIAGDILDTLKLKKDMPMSDEVKEVLVDVEHALNRIQDNVAQGGDVVQSLLKYTRKGDEGFSEVELEQLVNAAIEMMQFKIKANEITILKEYGAGLPKIKGNFTQLQEVFFNLIDNAYDAMQEKKEELKDEEYEPIIKISAVPQNNTLNIYFEDNGMGIKDEDKEKLFAPFFTTKLSSKKGTGLGLYVIRKLIEENHKGRVTYYSKRMQGTRVYIQLPIC